MRAKFHDWQDTQFPFLCLQLSNQVMLCEWTRCCLLLQTGCVLARSYYPGRDWPCPTSEHQVNPPLYCTHANIRDAGCPWHPEIPGSRPVIDAKFTERTYPRSLNVKESSDHLTWHTERLAANISLLQSFWDARWKMTPIDLLYILVNEGLLQILVKKTQIYCIGRWIEKFI